MNRLLPGSRRKEHGAVAVEFIILMMTVLVPLLVGAVFFGRFYWHYTVAEKAAQDAARFVAGASPTELKTQCSVAFFRGPCIVMTAMSLAYKETEELNPGGAALPEVFIYCDNIGCSSARGSAPTMISVAIKMDVEDPILTGLSSFLTGSEDKISFPITATARSHYVGN
ncbi:pilus assembly protein [Massilia sp. UMI-21]|nr:pilus assembly protein [Massilia sp. UMI-21]